MRLIPKQSKASASPLWLLAVAVVGVMLIIAVVHWPALSAKALCFDDEQYLTGNALVKNPSWDSASRFFCEVFKPSTVQGYYQPLTMISLMLDYARTAATDDLSSFHQTSLLLHCLNAALVITFIYGLFGHLWIAAAAGLVFGLHPMTVETIAWVGERKTLLAAFFSLISLNSYLAYTRKGGWKLYCAIIATYVLALASKPTSTPLPLLMLVIDFWPLTRFSTKAIIEKIPLLIIATAAATITIVSQASSAFVTMPGQYPPILIPVIICYSIVFYLGKIVLPVHLSSHYPFPQFNAIQLAVVMIIALALLAIALVSLKRTRTIFASLAFFALGLAPTMQVIGFSNALASDKYVYLPALGLLILACYGAMRLTDYFTATRLKTASVTVTLIIVIAEAAATRHYLAYWRNTETLFVHMIEMAPQASLPHNNLAVYYYQNGNIAKALEEWSAAIALSPNYPDALNNLAWIYATDPAHRDTKKAFEYSQRACSYTNNSNPGMLDTFAVIQAQRGNFDQAIELACRAHTLALQAAQHELADSIQSRLKFYKQHKPFVP